MPRRRMMWGALAATLLVGRAAFAAGSGGSGGPTGTRTDWPCTGCYTQVPSSYTDAAPAPLLIALHGDEGTAQYTWQVWSPYTDAQGYILLAPLCPQAEGCSDGSWWQWAGDPAWLMSQVAAVEAQYNVELDREYLSGWSGGATYTGAIAPLVVPKIAAFNLNAGGVPPQPATCPSCQAPAYFMIGDQDFLYDYAQATYQYFQGCGHETVWDELPGLDHQNGIGALYTQDKAATILGWLAARPNLCPADPGTGGSGGSGTGGSGTGATGGQGTGGGTNGGAGVGGGGPDGGESGGSGELTDSEEDAGCGCRVALAPRRARTGALSLLGLGGLLLARRRRASCAGAARKRHCARGAARRRILTAAAPFAAVFLWPDGARAEYVEGEAGATITMWNLAIAGSSCAVLDVVAISQLGGKLGGAPARIAVGSLAITAGLATVVTGSIGIAVSRGGTESAETDDAIAEAQALGGVGIAVGIVTVGLGIVDMALIPSEPEQAAVSDGVALMPFPIAQRDQAEQWWFGLGAAGIW